MWVSIPAFALSTPPPHPTPRAHMSTKGVSLRCARLMPRYARVICHCRETDNKVRQSAPLSAACHGSAGTASRWRAAPPQAGRQQVQYPRSAPTATCTQASRRQQGADPQQEVL